MNLIRYAVFLFVLSLSGLIYAQQLNIFQSPKVGFSITKPSDWQYLTAEQNLNNLKSIKLNDKEFQAAMAQYATTPLVVMAKFKEPYDDLNPSVKVNIKPLDQLKGTDSKQILSLILPQFEKSFKDFKLMQAPQDVQVGDLKAAYVRINYSLQIPDGRIFPTTSEVWIVPRGDYFFMIGAGTRQDEKNASRKEIDQIIKTIKIGDHL